MYYCTAYKGPTYFPEIYSNSLSGNCRRPAADYFWASPVHQRGLAIVPKGFSIEVSIVLLCPSNQEKTAHTIASQPKNAKCVRFKCAPSHSLEVTRMQGLLRQIIVMRFGRGATRSVSSCTTQTLQTRTRSGPIVIEAVC